MANSLDHIRAALDHERRFLVRRGEIAEQTEQAVRLRGEDRSWHIINWSSLTTASADSAIAAGSTEHRGYVACLPDGTPVGVGRLYTHPRSQFGGLYGGGTIEAYIASRSVYRARGICSSMHCPPADRFSNRLGFMHVADTWPCQWRAGSDIDAS